MIIKETKKIMAMLKIKMTMQMIKWIDNDYGFGRI